MNIATVVRSWLNHIAAKKRYRELQAIERRRNAIVKAIHTRKKAHREYKPLLGELRRATLDSLRASTGRAA